MTIGTSWSEEGAHDAVCRGKTERFGVRNPVTGASGLASLYDIRIDSHSSFLGTKVTLVRNTDQAAYTYERVDIAGEGGYGEVAINKLIPGTVIPDASIPSKIAIKTQSVTLKSGNARMVDSGEAQSMSWELPLDTAWLYELRATVIMQSMNLHAFRAERGKSDIVDSVLASQVQAVAITSEGSSRAYMPSLDLDITTNTLSITLGGRILQN